MSKLYRVINNKTKFTNFTLAGFFVALLEFEHMIGGKLFSFIARVLTIFKLRNIKICQTKLENTTSNICETVLFSFSRFSAPNVKTL